MNHVFSKQTLIGLLMIGVLSAAAVVISGQLSTQRNLTEQRSKAAGSTACEVTLTIARPTGSPTPTFRIVPSNTPTRRATPRPITPTPTRRITITPTACLIKCSTTSQCPRGQICQGSTLVYSPAGATKVSSRIATKAELAKLKADQNISMTEPGRVITANGWATYTIISRKATTLNMYLFEIKAPAPKLDPQVLVKKVSLAVGANTVNSIRVTVPACGRYQIDFGSPVVINTPYHVNPASTDYFWGDNILTFSCTGCCVPQPTRKQGVLLQ